MNQQTNTTQQFPQAADNAASKAEAGTDPLQSDDPEPAAEPSPHQPGEALQLDIIFNTQDTKPPLDGWVRDLFAKAVSASGQQRAQICLVFVDDAEMSVLHEQYKNIPGTTDVLTFDNRDNPADPPEGDIVICIDEAARQAKRRNIDTRTEVLLYAVHGYLHLLGHDDHDPEEFRIMHAEEDRILTGIGIGVVFHREQNPTNPT